MEKKKSAFNVKTLVTLGMLTALAFAVMWVCKFIPSVIGFLDFDLKDTIMCIAGFLFGPVAALCMVIIVPVLELAVGHTGIYGLIMNIFATALFVIPTVSIYRHKRKISWAIGGLCAGVLCLAVGMVCWNYIITPLYMGVDRSVVLGLMPVILVFNLVKGVLNAAAIMVLYPPLSAALRKMHLVPPSKAVAEGEKRKFNFIPLIASVFVLITAICLVWVLVSQ